MPTATNHAPVTGAMVASAATALVLAALKRYGFDAGDLAPQIQTIAVAVGYFFAKGSL